MIPVCKKVSDCFPTFSSLTFENDIGLLELAHKIVYDRFKAPAALVQPNTDLEGQKVFRSTVNKMFKGSY